MGLGEHAGFIIAGYLISFAVIVGFVLWSVAQNRRVHARIEELEARGVKRRSDQRVASTVAEPRGKV